jgi:DNA polymerase-4
MPPDTLRQTGAHLIDASRDPSTPARGGAPARKILHVDCDAFFVQVARLEDPSGAGRTKLLIVGGSPSGRGVVTSASYEARAYGVRSAMPTAHALRLCPGATVVSVPRDAIGLRSRAVRDALRELAPVVEAASVDEFYLDLTGTERLFKDEPLPETADRIRRTVLARTEISTSVGGGSNRLVAKLATSVAKPAGVHIVPPGEEGVFLSGRELEDIPGIGPALLEALAQRGLRTVRDTLAVEPVWLERWFGARRAAWLRARLEGRGADDIEPERERKSISSERTFHRDVDDPEVLDAQLLRLSEGVGRTLRDQGLRARTVTVKLKDFDFKIRQRAQTLPQAVESDRAIWNVARPLLGDLRAARRVPARLLGVGLGGLESSDTPRQLGLFGEGVAGESERERDLSRAVDKVRDRFGPGAVSPARLAGRRTTRRSDPPTDGGEDR